ncbi:MAG TPA: hypothetical protein VHR86_06995, partial [Armatimonadota bacterium]|nr:hypothetical protein [Armatimonadota bacterium]
LESAQAPYNPYMAPYINFHKRLDEVTRALRWQRLMPAFGVNETPVAVSDQILYDHWDLKEEIAWSGITNREVVQAAPAVVARGMRLPVVRGKDMLPFVTAACHPETGAVAVATLPRCDIEHSVVLPHADVQIELEHMESPVGVFGEYHILAIILPQPLGARSVWAQDLAGEEAVEITARIHAENNTLFIPGDLISTIGRSASSAADLSYPGMLLRITE